MSEVSPRVVVLGDSHSRLFFPTQFFAGRCGYHDPLPAKVVGKSISAASLAGFRPGVSTLQVKETIADWLREAQRMALAFGQVDLELGYYYRKVVKEEDTDPERYVSWLLSIYSDFLKTLDFSRCDLALKGVNLTALTPKEFSAQYVSRIITESKGVSPRESARMIDPYILSENDQNEMHLSFNSGLARVAHSVGARYFDLNDALSGTGHPDLSVASATLTDYFKTGAFDHHVVDSVVTRRVHFEGLLKAFELI